MKNPSRVLVSVTVLATWLGVAAAAGAAELNAELWQQLQQYQYGQDPKVLNQVEKMVGEITAHPNDRGPREQLAERLAGCLDPNATPECKQFVCRQLALIGTSKQVPILAKFLTDEQLSDMARYALGPIPDPAVDRALRDALARTSGKIQIGLIDTLGYRRDAQAVRPLEKLAAGPEADVRQAAAAALGRIGGNEAARALKRALGRADGKERSRVADACLVCADDFRVRLKLSAAAAIYRALFSPDESPRTRVGALRGWMAVDERAALPAVVASLEGSDPALKKAAIGCLRLRRSPESTRRVAAELDRLPVADQIRVLEALADRPDPLVAPVAAGATRSADPELRAAGWQALGKVGDASTVDALIGAVSNGAASERAAALESLRILRGEGVDRAILRELPTVTPPTRVRLIGALVDRNAVAAIPVLLEAAAGPDATVATAAVQAAGQMADAGSLPTLIGLLSKVRDEGVRSTVEDALIAVTHKVSPASRRADLILQAWRGASDTSVKSSLLRVLGGIGDDQALPTLESALQHGNDEERNTALHVLADWPGAAAIPVLRDVFREDSNETHRILALRGFVRLVSQESEGGAGNALPLLKEAMTYVKRSEERKLVLSGLATVNNPQALELVEPCLADPEVKDEAALAEVKIANAIAGTQRDLARAAIEKAIAASSNAGVRQQANQVLQEIEQHEDFVTVWQVAGPYLQAGKTGNQLFDVAFDPEAGPGRPVHWRVVQIPSTPNRPAILDLLGLLGGDNRVAYLRTAVYADNGGPARLEIGTDDGVKVWLNGKLVHANNADRGLTVGEDHVAVVLKPGWNSLLLKVTQDGGGWAACVRLRRADGRKLAGVRFDGTHEDDPGVSQ